MRRAARRIMILILGLTAPRMLDRVRAKGKSEPLSIFEVFDGDSPEEVSLKSATQGVLSMEFSTT